MLEESEDGDGWIVSWVEATSPTFSIKNLQGILGVVVKGGLDHFNFRRRRSCTYQD
jgi:hypothetical protein